MTDVFQYHSSGLESPATRHFAVTPADGSDLANIPRALFIGGAGDIAIRDGAGTDVTYTVPAGTTLLIRAVRVLATGTTATGIVGWY